MGGWAVLKECSDHPDRFPNHPNRPDRFLNRSRSEERMQLDCPDHWRLSQVGIVRNKGLPTLRTGFRTIRTGFRTIKTEFPTIRTGFPTIPDRRRALWLGQSNCKCKLDRPGEAPSARLQTPIGRVANPVGSSRPSRSQRDAGPCWDLLGRASVRRPLVGHVQGA